MDLGGDEEAARDQAVRIPARRSDDEDAEVGAPAMSRILNMTNAAVLTLTKSRATEFGDYLREGSARCERDHPNWIGRAASPRGGCGVSWRGSAEWPEPN
jgi:hypothetical protein